jgi:hypothetical protein
MVSEGIDANFCDFRHYTVFGLIVLIGRVHGFLVIGFHDCYYTDMILFVKIIVNFARLLVGGLFIFSGFGPKPLIHWD